ncbi:hypothetical protein O181_038340 [Austropuccinia psidii MF-1]|uniref:Uncharacterized protein n=1 Tax=Austropuccinia psidii MF-1 TaxID=1389203 RepID=A0A9Q3HE20_9BASI|nr:hypothetical protein [Austropuccinia psidii MF-1]
MLVYGYGISRQASLGVKSLGYRTHTWHTESLGGNSWLSFIGNSNFCGMNPLLDGCVRLEGTPTLCPVASDALCQIMNGIGRYKTNQSQAALCRLILPAFYIYSQPIRHSQHRSLTSPKMFIKVFKFQLLIVALAFSFSSTVGAVKLSRQVCQKGCHHREGDSQLTCDNRHGTTYTCEWADCQVTVNKVNTNLHAYYFVNCKPDSGGQAIPALHPWDFHVSSDGRSLVVHQGWYFTTSPATATIKERYTCEIGNSWQNQVRPVCTGCFIPQTS